MKTPRKLLIAGAVALGAFAVWQWWKSSQAAKTGTSSGAARTNLAGGSGNPLTDLFSSLNAPARSSSPASSVTTSAGPTSGAATKYRFRDFDTPLAREAYLGTLGGDEVASGKLTIEELDRKAKRASRDRELFAQFQRKWSN